jgi:hypothetical protein
VREPSSLHDLRGWLRYWKWTMTLNALNAHMKGEGMNFEQALRQLKNGAHVHREGWNDRGMFVFLVTPSPMSVPANNLQHAYGPGAVAVKADPYIAMKTAQGSIVPWLASQGDLLATDWYVKLGAGMGQQVSIALKTNEVAGRPHVDAPWRTSAEEGRAMDKARGMVNDGAKEAEPSLYDRLTALLKSLHGAHELHSRAMVRAATGLGGDGYGELSCAQYEIRAAIQRVQNSIDMLGKMASNVAQGNAQRDRVAIGACDAGDSVTAESASRYKGG